MSSRTYLLVQPLEGVDRLSSTNAYYRGSARQARDEVLDHLVPATMPIRAEQRERDLQADLVLAVIADIERLGMIHSAGWPVTPARRSKSWSKCRMV